MGTASFKIHWHHTIIKFQFIQALYRGIQIPPNTPAGVSHSHRRADALERMAQNALQNDKTSVNTADRFQVVVHVDHNVLAGSVNAKPDCYIENQVGPPGNTFNRRLKKRLAAAPFRRF